MRKLLFLLLLLNACRAPKGMFTIGPATPLAGRFPPVPPVTISLDASLPMTNVVGLPLDAAEPKRVRQARATRAVYYARRPNYALKSSFQAPRRGRSHNQWRASRRPVRSTIPDGAVILMMVLGILGAAISIVGLLVAALVVAAAAPWLIVLGISAGVFMLGFFSIYDISTGRGR